MEQPDLFGDGVGMVRNDHPDTSRVHAAVTVMPRTGTLRRQVYDWIVDRGFYGATDFEMQTDIPMEANTQRPRRVELCDAGLIADSGRRRVHNGNRAIVWVTAEIADRYRLKGNYTDVQPEP